MDLKKAILFEHSKAQALRISSWVDDKPERIAKLMDIFLHGEYRITQRAAYPLAFISDEYPHLFEPYFKQMIAHLDDDVHDAVVRNTLRLFQNINIPEDLEGELYEKCFHYLHSPKYPIAIRAFSMKILGNISIKYPELKEELIELINDVLDNSDAPGLIPRARHTIKQLKS